MGEATALFTSMPLDIVAIAVLVIVIGFDAVKNSIGRAAALAVAFPLGVFLHSLIPHTAFLKSVPLEGLSGAAVLFGAIILAFILARRIGLEFVSGAGGLMQGLFAGLAAVVVIIVMWIHSPLLDSLYHLSDPVRMLFHTDYSLYWLLGAYAVIAFARG